MKKNIFVLMLIALLAISTPAVAAGETQANPESLPRLSDLSFNYSPESRILEVNLNYERVAGDIADARFTLVISVKESVKTERLYALRLGKPRVIREAADYNKDKNILTEGPLQMFFIVPESIETNGGKNITGFGLVIVDASGRSSPALFIEVEVENLMEI